MILLKKPLFLFLTLSLVACVAAEKTLPLPDASVPPVRPAYRSKLKTAALITATDPEQAFQIALDFYKAGKHEAAYSAVRLLQENHPGSIWYKRSLFLMEQVFIQLNREPEAEAAMLRVKAEYPVMADYALSLLADYHYSNQRFTRAAALYQNLSEKYSRSSLAMRAAYRNSQALFDASAYAPAADALEAFLLDNPRSEFAPDAALSLARSYLYDTRLHEALQAYREIWVKYPGTPVDQEAQKAIALVSSSGIEVAPWSEEEWYERARNLSKTNQHDKAIEAFNRVLDLNPKTLHRPEALFRIGTAQFNAGRRGDAAVLLQKFVSEYPRHERVPEALFLTGKALSKLGEREKSVKTFQKLVSNYPASEWADDALFLAGNVYREANDITRSSVYYGRLAAEYRDSKFADSGIWWMAWARYGAGEYGKAAQKLQELINRYPRSFLVHQARYWLGRIAEKTGNTAKAAEYYRTVLKRGTYTYYGYRASERLEAMNLPHPASSDDSIVEVSACAGDCPEDPLAAFDTDDGPPIWTEETRQLLTSEPSFRKTLELMHLDMKKEAAGELWYLQELLPRRRGVLIGLSKAFFELGDYYRSLLLVLRNYERYLEGEAQELPADLWLLAYPQGYWDAIVSYSRKYGQDPYFIASIIRQESQFSTEALSPAGARGVMQVMPATGEWIAKNIRLQAFDRAMLFESETAINLGTWYVSHLMKRFKGDPLLVAAAYNAGPDAVSGWVSRNGHMIDRDEFVESIPFAETRGYVKKILRNYAEYRRIYAAKSDNLQKFITGSTIGPVITEELIDKEDAKSPVSIP